MDPLLRSLTDEGFRSLVQEQRPAWAVPPREEAPSPAPRPSLWENVKQSGMDAVKGLNRGLTSDLVGAPVDIINVLLKAMDDTKMLPQRFSTQKPVGGSEWINEQLVKAGLAPAVSNSPSEAGGRLLGGFMNPASGPAVLGILVGARAAKNVGSLTEGKFHAGVQALERGEAPQAVWRTWGVAKTPEGKYVYELPLQTGESDAIRQFTQTYPDVALKVYRRAGTREGYFDPKTREIFAQGDPNLPPTTFGSRRGVLEHELQHAADEAEGLSGGARLSDPNYWNYAGEVRARGAEERLDPEKRRWEPSMTEDTDRMQQVIKQHPGAVAEAVDPRVKYDAREGLGAVPKNQDVDYFGFTREMKPSEFFKHARKEDIDPKRVEGLIEELKKGTSFGQPFFIPEWNAATKRWEIGVSSHEGRHRMAAIEKLYGDVGVPVHVFPSRIKEGQELRARHLTPEMKEAPFEGGR